tara:strand:- start:375 stop:641 length:267 start_codon:yes stop_codon:yes gene_type:complete
MATKTEKIYVGNGLEKFDGDMIEFSVNLTKVGKEASDFMFESKEGDKFIKLKVVKKKGGEDQYGKTHYVEVDTWKPTQKKEDSGDLPF